VIDLRHTRGNSSREPKISVCTFSAGNPGALVAQRPLSAGVTRLHDFALGPLARSDPVVLGLGMVFGVGLIWVSTPVVKRTTARIDRAFFRSAYDARQILESLVEETRTVTSREELAVLLGEIRQSLQPVFAAVYLADRDGILRVYPDSSLTNQSLPRRVPLLDQLARRSQAWQISDIHAQEHALLDDLAIFAPQHPECLVPILARGGALTGLLALGPDSPRSPIPVKINAC
jgi:hypothetical protein